MNIVCDNGSRHEHKPSITNPLRTYAKHKQSPKLLYTTTGVYTMLIKIQPDATVCRYLFTAKSLYMFRVSQHPSSEVLKTVTAASGTGLALHRGRIGTGLCESYDSHKPVRWREVAVPVL